MERTSIKMQKVVYIVHCIDTEGPLYQDFDVPFQMIKDMFGVDIEPSPENLLKLQRKEMDVPQKEEISKIVDPHRIKFSSTWEEIDLSLRKITDEKYRKILPDSDGNGWKYSWFCMDHVGFTGENPRRRDAGYHKIFDRYSKMVNEQKQGDIVQFHFHPVSFYGNYNDSGTAFWGNGVLNDILCHKIIDRGWFPSAFRPGFHTERSDSNWFLEQWIPFDYGNQSYEVSSAQPDMTKGRFGDWRGASLKWKPYHPSHDDYRKEGNCHRWITRCLNMFMRARQIEKSHVEEAFKEAEEMGSSILAFTGHDYKDIEFEIERVREIIKNVSENYPQVRFQYEDAVSAYKKCLGLKEQKIGMHAEIEKIESEERLIIQAENPIFGNQPYLAIRSKTGQYFWDNLDRVSDNQWSYVFDHNTIKTEDLDRIGISANSLCGNVETIILSVN